MAGSAGTRRPRLDHRPGPWRSLRGGSSTPTAVAGYPAITVPAGHIHGLPIGISFFGRAWSEPVLIRIAHAFEQATRARRPPRFLPTVNPGAPSARSF